MTLLLAAGVTAQAPPREKLGPPAPAEAPPAAEGQESAETEARPAATPNRDQVIISADYARRDERRDTLFAEGNVHLRWEDVDVTGQRLFGDFVARTLHFDGPIRVSRADGTVFDTSAFDLDLDKYWYTTDSFTATIPPSVIGRGAVEPFYIRGSDSISQRDTYFSAHNVVFSSCPLNDRKYAVTARTIAVVPHRKMVFRSAKVFLFGVPILALGKLVVPLRQYRRTEWLPEFGRNDVYGFYGRMRYFYDLADSEFGNLSGMMTEKRGTFWGLEHDYGYGRGRFRGQGRVDLEYGSRQAELSARANLDQRLGGVAGLRVDGSFSRNSGFSTTTQQSNLTGTFQSSFAIGATTLGFNRSQTDSGSLQSAFTRYNLQQRFDLGPIFGAELAADYSMRQSTGQANDHELNTRFRFNGRWSLFDWSLVDERRFDVEGSRYPSDDNRAVTDIIPQITLTTDSRRVGLGLSDYVNLRLDSSVGMFREFVTNPGAAPPSLSTVMRVNFDLNGDLPRVRLGENARLLSSFRYSQSFFDHPDPAAKYIVAFAPGFEWRPWDNTRFDLGYRWQEVAGFSPLSRFDFAQSLNDLSYGARFFVPDRVRPRQGILALSFDGGYDLLLGRHRDLRMTAQFQPIDEMMIQLNTSYALFGGFGGAGFRSVRGEVTVETGPRYQHDIGFTYNPRTGKFQTVDSLLTIEPLRHLTFQNALTYDGMASRISYNDLLATYDMGCVQLIGTYRQQTQEFRIDLNITAFPGISSLFGTGRFGQQFSTSQGFQF